MWGKRMVWLKLPKLAKLLKVLKVLKVLRSLGKSAEVCRSLKRCREG